MDLATSEAPKRVERALAEALLLTKTTRDELGALMDRFPHRSATALLRELLQRELEGGSIRSEAERRLRELRGRDSRPR